MVGGGLASIDVAKVLMLETTRAKLRERGIEIDMIELEVKGIPKSLEKHGLRFEDLGLAGCTLFYRRRIEDMPLVEIPEDADERRREKAMNARARLLEKAQEKYGFRVEPLSAPEALLDRERPRRRPAAPPHEDGERQARHHRRDVRAARRLRDQLDRQHPRADRRHPHEGRAVRVHGLGGRPPRRLPEPLLGRQRRHRQGQHRGVAQARRAGVRGRARLVPRARGGRPREGGCARERFARGRRGRGEPRRRAPGAGRAAGARRGRRDPGPRAGAPAHRRLRRRSRHCGSPRSRPRTWSSDEAQVRRQSPPELRRGRAARRGHAAGRGAEREPVLHQPARRAERLAARARGEARHRPRGRRVLQARLAGGRRARGAARAGAGARLRGGGAGAHARRARVRARARRRPEVLVRRLRRALRAGGRRHRELPRRRRLRRRDRAGLRALRAGEAAREEGRRLHRAARRPGLHAARAREPRAVRRAPRTGPQRAPGHGRGSRDGGVRPAHARGEARPAARPRRRSSTRSPTPWATRSAGR